MVSEQETAIPIPRYSNLTYREIHAFEEGFYCGYRGVGENEDYEQEKHWWRSGYVIGDIIDRQLKDD